MHDDILPLSENSDVRCCGLVMTALDNDGQNSDISWIDARNPIRLGEILRTISLQFLATFISDGCAGIIVKPIRNNDGFVSLRPFGRNVLLPNIAFVLFTNPELFNDGSWNR